MIFPFTVAIAIKATVIQYCWINCCHIVVTAASVMEIAVERVFWYMNLHTFDNSWINCDECQTCILYYIAYILCVYIMCMYYCILYYCQITTMPQLLYICHWRQHHQSHTRGCQRLSGWHALRHLLALWHGLRATGQHQGNKIGTSFTKRYRSV